MIKENKISSNKKNDTISINNKDQKNKENKTSVLILLNYTNMFHYFKKIIERTIIR